MSVLLAAIGIGILSYVAFVMMFPKALPEDGADYTRAALERIYEENRAGESEQVTILRDALKEESFLVRTFFSMPTMRPMYEAALQAGYAKSLDKIIYAMISIFFLALFGFIHIGLSWLGIVMAAGVAYILPFRHCKKRVRKRNRKFIDQFPDALDMIVRSVKSGFPLSVALQMLAENAENPVKQEFRMVVDDVALGRTLQNALQRLASRINEADIRFFVVVLTVQQETGGNLAEIIGNLSTIIRKRKQLRHKIHAMTSEGRATAWVLGMLPVFVFVALWFISPDYLTPFWTDTAGMMMLGTAIGLVLTCAFVVKQMVNVDI